MKITITIDDATPAVLSALAMATGQQVVIPTPPVTVVIETPAVPPTAPVEEPAGADPAPAAEEPETTPAEPDPAAAESPNPEPAAEPSDNALTGMSLAEIIAAMNAKYKATARLGLEGGQVGKGDRIVTEEGEVGQIMSTWRGRALVEFQPEEYRMLESKDMAPATPTSGKDEGQVTTESALREMASEVVKKRGAGELSKVLKEQFGVARISMLTPDRYEDCKRALEEVMA
jgi:hypothetical protein